MIIAHNNTLSANLNSTEQIELSLYLPFLYVVT